ncbi:MAG: DUF4290 domain-containing protein [Prevotella sp.]|nr:DUF4290 domain-containing protein [Prevotella sp.]MCM1075556.1 DUF4290 domain-containing protein [Ruminococcus sp.]
MDYNTDREKLVLPEYGRNVQNMVDYCLTIPDREERTLCAKAIVGVMRKLTPQQANTPEKEQKLWDHLNMMANFALDIDFPVEVLGKEELNPAPKPIPYSTNRIRWRHYGKNIEGMIQVVANLEDGEDKDMLISLIAHQMKKLQFVHNKEGVDDAKILRDLAIYSDGKIDLDPETYPLHEFKEVKVPVGNSNNKRKQQNRKRR